MFLIFIWIKSQNEKLKLKTIIQKDTKKLIKKTALTNTESRKKKIKKKTQKKLLIIHRKKINYKYNKLSINV